MKKGKSSKRRLELSKAWMYSVQVVIPYKWNRTG